ncbi:ead/Ea22-like family protein [Klebsiella michiganensis]
MTDITELAQSLKAAAEKAGRDEWLHVSKPSREVIEASCGSVIATTYCTNDTAKKTYNEQLAESQAKAEFIALANPANILALVEALEKAQQRIDELENDEVRQRLANAYHQLHMAELAKNNLRASLKAQFRKRKAAEQRIAELESRTVKLPKIRRVKLVSGEYVNGWTAHDVACALSAAGIKVEAE